MAVKLSALRAGRSLAPRKIHGRLSRPQGHSVAGRIRWIENSIDLIGNRTRDLPTYSIVPQSTMLSRDPLILCMFILSVLFVFMYFCSCFYWGKHITSFFFVFNFYLFLFLLEEVLILFYSILCFISSLVFYLLLLNPWSFVCISNEMNAVSTLPWVRNAS
jgi:hypothetical protein